MVNPDEISIEEWYKNNYSRVNATAVSDSLANKILHKLIEKPFKSNLGLEILEVGANTGEHLKFVTPDFAKYVMTDIRFFDKPSSSQLVSFQVADVQNLVFLDNSFDRVVSTCVFHHLDDPIKGFEQLRRVTKVGGTISILIPNDPGILYRFLRSLTTLRNARKLELLQEAELIHAIEHRNHYLQLRTLMRYVYRNDKIKSRSFPFRRPSYNFNALTVFEITILPTKVTNP